MKWSVKWILVGIGIAALSAILIVAYNISPMKNKLAITALTLVGATSGSVDQVIDLNNSETYTLRTLEAFAKDLHEKSAHADKAFCLAESKVMKDHGVRDVSDCLSFDEDKSGGSWIVFNDTTTSSTTTQRPKHWEFDKAHTHLIQLGR